MVLATLVGRCMAMPNNDIIFMLTYVIGYVCASGNVVVDDEGTVGGT